MIETPGKTKPKRVKLRDVAERAGVDASLVSRVLNDHPKASAGPATRMRILEAARELGYQPNVAARGLRTAKTWTLGLLLPNLTNPMYATIARACARRAQERGYGLVFGTHVEGEDADTFVRMMQQGRVDGLLTASGVLGDAFLRRVATGAMGPLVMLNRRVRGVRSFVTVDDTAGAAMATRHLAELGHTEVAGIFGPGAIDTTVRRLRRIRGGWPSGEDPPDADRRNGAGPRRRRRGRRPDIPRAPRSDRNFRLDLRDRHGRSARRPPGRRAHPR